MGKVTEAQIKNESLRKTEGGSDLLHPRRGREDDFVSLGSCRSAMNRFDSLRLKIGLGRGHVDPDLIAATIRNEQHHFKQLYDTGTDNYVQKEADPKALDGKQSIGPGQVQIRNIHHFMKRYPEQLVPFKENPLKAATRPGDAPNFVAAYYANVIEGSETGERPEFITEKTWEKVTKLWKEGKANDALIYSYNPDPEQVKHINEQLGIIWGQRRREQNKD